MSKKRFFILIIVLTVVIAVVVMLNIRLRNKSSTDGMIEIAEVKSGESLSQREGKKIEVFYEANLKIIEITQTINSKANGIYDVTINFHAEKCIKEIKNMTTTETLFEANADLENWKDIEINRQGEKDTVNTYKITMANGYEVERDIKISDFFPENNTAPSKPEINISPNEESISMQTAVTITAQSTDPEQDEIEYIWEGGRNKETDYYTYGEHTIRVKAVDLYGAESAWSEYSTFTVKKDAAPYITYDQEPEYIDPKTGTKWYPVETIATIHLAENMENLTGYIKWKYGEKDDTTRFNYGSESVTKETTVEYTLNETETFRARMIDSEGEESAILEEEIHIMANNGRIQANYSNMIGNIYPVKVNSTGSGSVKGTDIYTTGTNFMGSFVYSAAVHMGLIQSGEEKILKIQIVEAPEGGYIGSTRNGITSQSTSNSVNGFIFVDNDGNAINRVQMPEKPYITLNQEPDYIDPQTDIKWYPAGTVATIHYSENMSYMTGYSCWKYGEIDDVNFSYGSQEITGESISNHTLTETETVKAVVKNYFGEESAILEEEIHIMANNGRIQGNYATMIGNIYPVKVNSTGSGIVRGTDIYTTGTNFMGSFVYSAAVHMGLIQSGEEKILKIQIINAPEGGYIGSTRNGITSQSTSNSVNGFIFVDDEGNKIEGRELTT